MKPRSAGNIERSVTYGEHLILCKMLTRLLHKFAYLQILNQFANRTPNGKLNFDVPGAGFSWRSS